MSWIAVATVGGSLVGSVVTGNATKKAQQSANATNQQLATDKSNFDWNNYLLQRGYNTGGTASAGEIPANSSAVNTFLPLWANVNGQPAEQAILDAILKTSGVGTDSGADNWLSIDNTRAALAANPQMLQDITAVLASTNDQRSPEQWLLDDIKEGDPNSVFIQAVKDAHQAKQVAAAGTTPLYQDLQAKAASAANDLFDGKYLQQQLDALAPILQARTSGAENIYNASLDAANGLYDAGVRSANGIYDSGVTGAKSIYDADLLQADTYQQSALQALNRLLNQNAATRARQGFTGTTSGDALTRARLMADYTQQGAGVRAAAGQTLAQRLAANDLLRAQSLGGADVTRAGTTGTAGVTRASTLGAAGEQDAMSRLSLLTSNIDRMLAGVNLPSTLASNDLAIRSAGNASKYADLDALLSRLSMFRTNATPSSLVTPNVSPTVNTGQIIGGAITNAGQAYGDYRSTQDLLAAIKGMGGSSGSYKGIPILASSPSSQW